PASQLLYCSLFAPPLSFNYSNFYLVVTATTEIYTHSLHDALPISPAPSLKTLPGDDVRQILWRFADRFDIQMLVQSARSVARGRSEEHTSELQSRENLVCRLLLEKKK